MDILALSDKAFQHNILQDLFFISWIAFGLGCWLHRWLQSKLPTMPWQLSGSVSTVQIQPTDVLGAFLVTLPFCSPLLMPYAEKATSSHSNFSLAFSFFTLIAIASVVIAIYYRRGYLVEGFGLIPKSSAPVVSTAIYGYLAIFVLSISLEALGLSDWLSSRLGERQNQDIVNEVLKAKDTTRIVILVIGACIVAPFAEEIIFRGYLYPAMKRYAGPYVAALASGVIFGAMHVEIWSVIPLSLFGILLAALYERSGSIYTCMLTHCIFNTVTITLLLNPQLLQQAQ